MADNYSTEKQPDSRPANFNDLASKRFGRWSVLSFHGRSPGRSGGAIWLCRCECGNERPVKAASLQSGRSQSCGCLHKEISSKISLTVLKQANTTHGLSRTKEYAAWNQMLQRCHNEKNPTFSRYGATGIKVCDRWRNSFEDFLADIGSCPSSEHTLDRINSFGNYEPGNCRWATDEQQRLNQRRTRRFPFQGEMLSIPEISKKANIAYKKLYARLVILGWTIEEATS